MNKFAEQTNQELIEGAYDDATKTRMIDIKNEGGFLTNKQLNEMLPQVFTRDGHIRKSPDYTAIRGVAAIAREMRKAEITREAVVNQKHDLCIHMKAGMMLLSGEIRDVIVAADMFVDLFLKGWVISTQDY